MDGGDWENLLEAERSKFCHAPFGPVVVHFVDGKEHRLARGAELGCHFAVEGHYAVLDVDYQDDSAGRFDGHFHLFHGGRSDRADGFFTAQKSDTTGVDESETVSVPFGFSHDAIACYPGFVVHNGNTAAHHSIE